MVARVLGCFHGDSRRRYAIDIDELTRKIIACAIEVHRILGPGLLESVYRECLLIELRLAGLRVDVEKGVAIEHKGHRMLMPSRSTSEGCVVLELKAVERLHPVFQAQALTYLKLTGCPAGLILFKVTFHTPVTAARRRAPVAAWCAGGDSRVSAAARQNPSTPPSPSNRCATDNTVWNPSVR